ncbi:MAG: hypothetical protein CMB51_02045 [Euryarchaeota archaeon]|nr:hypothetical protein [Euryarchaeota archaeon]
MDWETRFLQSTPGEVIVNSKPREVVQSCWVGAEPEKHANVSLLGWTDSVAAMFGIQKTRHLEFAGQKIVNGMQPFAHCYGGHQFGQWAGQLGDGRAISIGEGKNQSGVYHEFQLKGSGLTAFSRRGDGKAVLRSSIREFLCSEAMHALGVPTTRALSLHLTGQKVMRDMFYDGNPIMEPGAIICRVAPSFIRFGSFQIHTSRGDFETLESLVDYTISEHFSHIKDEKNRISMWLDEIIDTTVEMVIDWMRVGFVHGVMNTDNMSIHGLTIDYGPYGWIEDFDPNWTPNTTDASTLRYRFGHQPRIALWNIARLLEAISPLVEDRSMLQEKINDAQEKMALSHEKMWVNKLGLKQYDEELVLELVELMYQDKADMTMFFRLLSSLSKPELHQLEPAFYNVQTSNHVNWNIWLNKYLSNTYDENRAKMNLINPKYVLRNWMAQLAIDDAEKEDYAKIELLTNLLKDPYGENHDFEKDWFRRRPEWALNRPGCSMLSCSS